MRQFANVDGGFAGPFGPSHFDAEFLKWGGKRSSAAVQNFDPINLKADFGSIQIV